MIFIVIPAYNEESSVTSIVKKARPYGKTIVVDDGSSDKTTEIARNAGALVVTHRKNSGLGSSIRTGISEALRLSKNPDDIIITLDADGQHNPDEIPRFAAAIRMGYDFVLGQRDLSIYPFRKRIGNFALTKITNIMTRTYIRDTESGFRAFRRSSLEKFRLKARRYEIAAEIIREVGRNHLAAKNVPITSPVYIKGVSVLDGVRNLIYLFKVVFNL